MCYITGKISTPIDEPLVMCDFGSADGGNSKDLIAAAIGK